MDIFSLLLLLYVFTSFIILPYASFSAARENSAIWWILIIIYMSPFVLCCIEDFRVAILLIPSFLSYIVGMLWKKQYKWYNQRLIVALLSSIVISLTIVYEFAVVYCFFNIWQELSFFQFNGGREFSLYILVYMVL